MASGGNLQCGVLISLLWAEVASVCNRLMGCIDIRQTAVKGVVILVYYFSHGSTPFTKSSVNLYLKGTYDEDLRVRLGGLLVH